MEGSGEYGVAFDSAIVNLDPNLLVTLWRVGSEGSLTAAARVLGWSQPAVSQQVRKLERDCGCQLIERTGRGAALTPAGAILAKHGELIALRLAQAGKEFAEYRRRTDTSLRLLAPPSICSTIVSRALAKLSVDSTIDVSLAQAEPPEAIAAVARDEADCAVIFRYESIPQYLVIDDDVQFDRLGDDPLLLLARKTPDPARGESNGKQTADARCATDGRDDSTIADAANGTDTSGANASNTNAGTANESGATTDDARSARSERHPRTVRLREYADHGWIAGCPFCQTNLLSMARREGFEPNITYCVDDYATTQSLVAISTSVSIVSRLASMAPLPPNLELLPIDDPYARRGIGIITRRGDDRPAVRTLADELRWAAAPLLER
ncbi:LysR family transcriptional regulator [Bifidobacterium amazonense]|uniref:LysR family transcriptional regulator n=1 Tax=Bifidobacterium amazonense TaxID=2809027 RepID=A0ABS9VTM4_9BIFI|nr:LysR family transcriptional regulator [Bifidobacterium amazonense]MCH9275459.1 LysR family transcriptional regulator [Bifidobacterium amazonense]